MEIKQSFQNTIPQHLSSKTILLSQEDNLKQRIKQYFLLTYQVYEKLFQLITQERVFYHRYQPLRHPLIFYYGHTASLYVNKFIDHGIIQNRINQKYQKMFAVGVDQMDWDDLNESHYDWPSLADAKIFRDKVKDMVLTVIDNLQQNKVNNWLQNAYVILLGIQHQRIHLETSAVIIRRVPLKFIRKVPEFPECPIFKNKIQQVPQNQLVQVKAWKSTWHRTTQNSETYGWDNQFGQKQFDVKEFKASKMLVSNAEYLKFVQDNGYQRPQLWTNEGQRWIKSIKPKLPLFWIQQENQYKLRTLSSLIAMPWDWPVEVNNLQARAFCNWRSLVIGKYTRLPTEDEWYSMRDVLKQDQPTWKYQQVGNINMQYWMSPNPVDLFKIGDFYDLIGNVWQHTITPIYPFKQFKIHPVYEDFSTPTFDQRHDLIKGGSFISTGNQALYHARYAFRRHFYQFAGFRYIQSDFEMQVDLHCEQIISDKNVEMNLKHHYQNQKSYLVQFLQKIKQLTTEEEKQKKILTVGCSVGRLPLQLGKYFQQSIGIDYTTRYFQMSSRLQQKGFLKFKDIDIQLSKLDLNHKNVSLFQMNPQNPDQKKINNCDYVIIDGINLKKGTLSNVILKILPMITSNSKIIVLTASSQNYLSKQQIKKILQNKSGTTIKIQNQIILNASKQDQSYLPLSGSQQEMKLNIFKLSQK